MHCLMTTLAHNVQTNLVLRIKKELIIEKQLVKMWTLSISNRLGYKVTSTRASQRIFNYGAASFLSFIKVE